MIRRRGVVTVSGWLRIDCGQPARGRAGWVRYPAAEYECLRCGRTEVAAGDTVPVFTASVRAAHRTTCAQETGVLR